MSRTVEIPRERWGSYLDDLSKRAKDRAVRVEAIGLDVGDQELAHMLPLVGVDFDRDGYVDVSVATKSGLFDHRVERPTKLYVEESDDGFLEVLYVEDTEGERTLVYFDKGIPAPGSLAETHAPHG